jgi:PAS domain S-box-containing protein
MKLMNESNNGLIPRLLIVDDEEAIRETLGDIFQEKGFDVTLAGTGQIAIEKARSTFFNIALIDIKLPDIDGMDLLKELKTITPRCAGIIITGNASLQNAIDALKDGADGYFVKPLKIDEVLYKINEFLEKQRLLIELENSEEKFRTLTEELSIGIMIIKDDVILYANDALSQIMGIMCTDLLGQSIEIIFNRFISGDRVHFIQQLHSNDVFENYLSRGTYRIVQHDDKIKWIEILSRFIEYKGVQAISISIIDISEKKVNEEQLKNLNLDLERKVQERTSELEEANRAKSAFLANMSHELRTPLNSIMGFSEALMKGFAGALTDEQKDYINDIFESGEHLLRLINDVLDLSKIEAGKMDLVLDTINIPELIEYSVYMFKERIAKHALIAHVEISDTIDFITCDELKLKQILFNLLSNAIKFTHDGGNIGINVDDSANEIVVTVWDTGIGISKENQEKLFKPFERIETSETKAIQGTGLGLHYTKKLIELHGGRIWQDSVLGQGSKFFFTIPKNLQPRSKSLIGESREK